MTIGFDTRRQDPNAKPGRLSGHEISRGLSPRGSLQDVVGSHFNRIELISVLYVGHGYVVDCSRYPREPSRGGAAR